VTRTLEAAKIPISKSIFNWRVEYRFKGKIVKRGIPELHELLARLNS